ncbi:MAG: hypothetical protein PHO20_03920 [Candidatus Peribacteraceae bacterium]|nr:hypothetical protein [Candidatus Peribacteraceae bacterium]MDD5739888.1 hypothetical protein [Candidatus Peribacteraceae bacterium]
MSHTVPIRAIVGRFSLDFSRRALERALQKCPFEFCADISATRSPGEPFPPFAGIPAEQQDHFVSSTIRNGQYEGADWNKIAPLDEELLIRMSECESVFMAIVTRLEWKRSILYATRKRWYLRHLQFWNDYLTRHRINLYLSAWIPHEIPDIIIYHLCKARGIPVLYFNTTELRDTSFVEHDIRQSAIQIQPRYQQLLDAHVGQDIDTIPLSEPFASYEQALIPRVGMPPEIEKVKIPTYWGHLYRLVMTRPLEFLQRALRYCTPGGWKRAFLAARRWHAVREREHFYAAHAAPPDFNRPFVYFPLHFQPEATTIPMGGVFADLILATRLLNATLPKDVLIYIKEHPRRSGWQNRSIEYYKEFLELEKVRLVPTTVDTFALREHCLAVATVTGSAGFEALFREKPVFLFGSRYFQFARGVFPVRSLQECKEAVHAVFERKEKPTRLSTHLYLKAMEETCLLGVLDPWSLEISHLPEDEHVRVMSEAIVTEVARIFLFSSPCTAAPTRPAQSFSRDAGSGNCLPTP